MFERYTEKARRVIFFARYEASQLGADIIDIEHILLGIFREDKVLISKFFPDSSLIYASIRQEIEHKYDHRTKAPQSIDLPLSSGAKRVFQWAADFSTRFSHNYIGTEHLLLGILNEEQSTVSQLLRERGLNADLVAGYVQSGGLSSGENRSWPVGGISAITGGGTESRTQEFVKKQLLNQFDTIVNTLVGHGYITPEELIDRITGEHAMELYAGSRFQALLDLLVGKGVISEEEKQKINMPED